MFDELNPRAFVSADAALLQPPAPAARTPREQLIAATNSYFDGFAQSKGSIVPFDDACSRRENGMAATSNSAGWVADPAQPGFRVFSQGCAGELDRGFFSALSKVRDRRLLVVDEEQGLVLNVAVFRQSRQREDGRGERCRKRGGSARVSARHQFCRAAIVQNRSAARYARSRAFRGQFPTACGRSGISSAGDFLRAHRKENRRQDAGATNRWRGTRDAASTEVPRWDGHAGTARM